MTICKSCGRNFEGASPECPDCEAIQNIGSRPSPSFTLHRGGRNVENPPPSTSPARRTDETRNLRGSRSSSRNLAISGGLALAETPRKEIVPDQTVARDETIKRPAVLPDAMSSAQVLQLRPNNTPPAMRPPVLASEALREDLEPTEPGRELFRGLGIAFGFLGATLVFSLGGLQLKLLPLGALLAANAVLCFVGLSYAKRAASVLTTSVIGFIAAAWAITGTAGEMVQQCLLSLGTLVLSGGLLFRSSYRASRRARAIVGAGIALMLLWLLVSPPPDYASWTWQSSVSLALRAVFGILVLLSLLAFMGEASTGGTRVWGSGLLLWFPVHLAAQWALAFLPSPEAAVAPILFEGRGATVAAAMTAAWVFVALGAIALAHQLVVTKGGTTEDRRPSTM